MTDDLDLMQLASQGQKLARVDDVDYLAVQIVFAWPTDGAPSVYCAQHDWPHSHAARLAARDQAIAELEITLGQQAAESLKQAQRASAAEARIRELEAQLRAAPPLPTPKQNQEAMFRAQSAALDAQIAEELSCPDCDERGWKSPRSLQMHRQRAHQGMQTAKKLAALQFVEELGWRCKAKGCAGAHARDLHDPDFCTLHASRTHTNGVEVQHG
jgi:hypothetical protein